MVLAAGRGERMRPLTLLRAKPALPVLNRPLILWTLERLHAQGVTDVVVNLHHRPETIARALRQGRPRGQRLQYSRENEILGTAGGPRAVLEWMGAGPVLLVNGDVLFDFDLTRLVARHLATGARATLALRHNVDPVRYSPVVTGRDGRILSIAGLPRPTRGRVSLFTGVHVVDPGIFRRLPPGPSDAVLDLYAPLLADGERLLGVRVRGAWYDLGRPSLYRDAQLRWLRGGRSRIHPGARRHRTARLDRSVVGRGSRIGPGARVERSILWERAVVEAGARVRRSIVVEGGRVRAGERADGVIVMPDGRGRSRPRVRIE